MKALGALAVVLLGLAAVLLVNTLRLSTPQHADMSSIAADNAHIDANEVAKHLAEIVKLPTVSHQDAAEDDRSQFAKLRVLLETYYPLVHQQLQRALIAGDGLLYSWPAAESGNAEPVLLMAHQDVVPIEPGTESRWKHAPFSGDIAEGYVWGRGAIDDKGSLVMIFEALESLLRDGWKPARGIWLASGADEETGGEVAKAIVKELQRRKQRFAFVLDEGFGVTRGLVSGIQQPVAMISVAEKGYLSLQLTAHGVGGHSSAPPKESSVVLIARAIDRLTHDTLPARLLPITRQSLELMAPYLPLPKRVTLANLWLSERLVVAGLDAAKETSPMVRTTMAPTMLNAGVKDNVLPSTATAVINFRILPGDSAEKVVSHVRRVLDDNRIDVKVLERLVSEPSPLSSTTTLGYRALAAAVQQQYPDALITPTLMFAATDSRHFQSLSDAIYRFAPYTLSKPDLPSIHGTNERIAIADLGKAVLVYRSLLRAAAGKSP